MTTQGDTAEGTSDRASVLVKLATQRFGELTEAETTLFLKAANGELADYCVEKEEDNDPARAAEWGEDRVLKADRIAWVCTHPQASACVTHQGISVKGARVEGMLELAFVEIPFPLYVTDSALPEGVNLQYAQIPALNLSRSYTGPIHADGLKVQGALFLRDGLKVDGGLRLLGGDIGGQVTFAGAQFIGNKERPAICASTVRVRGDVLLSKDDLDNPFKAEGEVNLAGATIGGQLNCDGAELMNCDGAALKADSMKVGTDVFLRNGFSAQGEVRLSGARIGGELGCIGGRFTNPGAHSLSAEGIHVRGSVFLRDGFRAVGEVRLVGAEIGGQLSCDGGQFIVATGTALNAFSITVDGDVFLRGNFQAHGEVRLLGARIRRNLECEGASFVNPGRRAINADGLRVGGAILMRDIRLLHGVVSLVGAEIKGYLVWTRIASPAHLALDLSSARIGTLLDDSSSWPVGGRLCLDGLVYEELHGNSPTDAVSRIEWLHRQTEIPFRPQPYEHLASVLRRSGHEDDAKRILITKNEDRARLCKFPDADWWWYRIFGPVIGYGYRPWRAGWPILFFIVLGSILFGLGFRANVITPTQEWAYLTESGPQGRAVSEQYPRLSAVAYSLDTFVPLVDLHQSSYWLPNAHCRGDVHVGERTLPVSGATLRVYLWIHICGGWFFTTLLVVGLSGLVRT